MRKNVGFVRKKARIAIKSQNCEKKSQNCEKISQNCEKISQNCEKKRQNSEKKSQNCEEKKSELWGKKVRIVRKKVRIAKKKGQNCRISFPWQHDKLGKFAHRIASSDRGCWNQCWIYKYIYKIWHNLMKCKEWLSTSQHINRPRQYLQTYFLLYSIFSGKAGWRKSSWLKNVSSVLIYSQSHHSKPQKLLHFFSGTQKTKSWKMYRLFCQCIFK